ncbi:MAG TPA: PHP domain-containing protein, partial [Modestobacter sp.]|nr:PHP domain-containing protein [Modestobacter sp.]
MNDPFVHLHVASGYSMRYGANHPADLVTRAAEHGMTALALTDRDGLYGAVKFALACRSAGVRPIFGVDLAIAPVLDTALPPALAHPVGGGARPRMQTAGSRARPGAAGRRVPARGGASVDLRLPRATFLARDGAGWRSLCRLTSATHLRSTRGEPVSSLAMAAEHATGLIALLGPESAVGRALITGRAELALAHLDTWRAAFGPG